MSLSETQCLGDHPHEIGEGTLASTQWLDVVNCSAGEESKSQCTVVCERAKGELTSPRPYILR